MRDVRDKKGNPLYTEGALYEIMREDSLDGGTDSTEQTEIICRFRPDGTLTYVNEAYCRYFGCDRQDLENRNILLTISEQDRENVLSQLQNLRPERPVGTMECRVRSSFGEIFWNQWSYRAIFDDEGHVLEYRSVGRDITYRKYTQDVLEKRAAILEAMTAAAEGFLKSSSWSDKIEPVLESFGKATGASHVFLFENDLNREGGISVRRRFEWFSSAISHAKARKRFLKTRDLSTRFSQWVFSKSEGKPICGTVGQFPDREVESLALDPTLSIAVVPITVGGRWWGFVGFADYLNEIVWADEEIAPLEAAAGILGAAIERDERELALRKNEALLQSILKAAPIGVGIVHDRVIGWVNEHFTRITGYQSDDVIGKNARMLYPDEGEFERVGSEKYKDVRKGKTSAVETRWRKKDGTVFDVYLSFNTIDTRAPSSGVVFTAFDITDQKKAADILRFAREELEKLVTERTRELDITNMLLRVELEEHRKTEEALAEKEQLYRAIVEDQTELICRFNPDGTLSFVNEAFCRYFGKNREELLGTHYRPLIPREDRDVLTNSVKALTPEHNVAQLEIQVELPGRGFRWLLWTTRALYDEVGRLVEHQAVGRDVTERVRSQQQIQESRNTLRSVFDGISDPLLMVGADLTIIMLNKAALEFFDVGHYRELIGLPCLGHLIERYGKDHAERVNTAIEESTPSRFNLTANVKAIRYEEISVYPVRSVDDGKGLAIIRVTDRTKQVIMERELVQSEKLASLGLLITGIVHEINNPNNFIVFNIPILRDYLREILPVVDAHAENDPMYEVLGMAYPDFRADVMKLLDNIEHGSHRINVTVAKLKEFSRKREDKGLRTIASAEVVNKALSICHTQIRKTVKTFDVEIDPGLARMTTDPDAIEQVLINLLINAAQAADKEDSLIRVHVYRGDSWKNRLVMEVIDNGCGMDATTASRIFDPFFTTKEEGCGTGLGLYISKNLIEAAGGSIAVVSEPGRGTTFRVIFPDMESRNP